eukprot:scaffold133953_cov19-Tisochrysis_lutea.AAC.1
MASGSQLCLRASAPSSKSNKQRAAFWIIPEGMPRNMLATSGMHQERKHLDHPQQSVAHTPAGGTQAAVGWSQNRGQKVVLAESMAFASPWKAKLKAPLC